MNRIRPLVLAGLLTSLPAWALTPAHTLVIAQSLDDATSFDPAEGFELSTVQAFNSLYQRLVQSDPAHPAVLKPVLAASWHAGADGHSLEFTLRPGARFASGNALRPEDVIFSLSRVIRLNKDPAFILGQLGWTRDNVGRFLTRTGPAKVKVAWTADVGPAFVLSLLSAPASSIVDARTASAHEIDGDQGNAWLKTHSAGSGPYAIRSYQPHQALVLSGNPLSPAGAPRLDTVLIKNVPDPAARRLLIEQGDADIARNLGPDQIAALQGKPGVTPLAVPSASIHYLAFNIESSNPVLKNPALWEAARWLIDYDNVATTLLKGQFAPHQAFLPLGFPGALKERPYHFDPERARAILARAGLKEVNIRLDVNNQPPYLDVAQALQASFAKGGIRLNVVPAVGSQVGSLFSSRNYEAIWTSWGPDYFDPHTNASAFALNRNDGEKTLAWRTGWQIPALNAKTLAALKQTDPARRARAYESIEREVQRNSPFVVAFQSRNLIALRSSLKGYVQGITPDMVFYDKVSK
ncbi:ABC transporter substrate-binding protein [Paludibacterium yongneupense]|uniref:ABC transporter substrate-binding protein n=1 Tax=Paludibacterium yongneupense TaxID=400061 RepID=UPI0004903A0C|nr:ABC transporter substrate-binding protein [Paludibacterium yongneupense]